jgi:putative transposase
VTYPVYRGLGDSEFVSEILSGSEESLERCYALKASGMDRKYIAKRVATLLDIPESDVWREGKFKELVHARSLLCFWEVRELDESMTFMARRPKISTVAVSKSVIRGAEIAKRKGLEIL